MKSYWSHFLQRYFVTKCGVTYSFVTAARRSIKSRRTRVGLNLHIYSKLFAHAENVGNVSFCISWRRTKSMLEASSRKDSKTHKFPFEGVSRNRTVTGKERKMTLLEKICSGMKHQSPCQPKQLWECITVDGRPRLRKCRKNGAVQATTATTTRPMPSTAPTTPVKMCVCMKPRPGYENQGDMLPYDGECD